MHDAKSISIFGLVGALIAGIITVGSAYIGWILVDKTQLGWSVSRGFAFVALAVGVLLLVAILGGLESSSNHKQFRSD
jgi:uncharacterized membrane protein YbhN (UPF0104 family)